LGCDTDTIADAFFPARGLIFGLFMLSYTEFTIERCLFMLPELKDRLKELETRMIDLRGYL
jgi:hypothetical protein